MTDASKQMLAASVPLQSHRARTGDAHSEGNVGGYGWSVTDKRRAELPISWAVADTSGRQRTGAVQRRAGDAKQAGDGGLGCRMSQFLAALGDL
jgi:hypothetical protein